MFDSLSAADKAKFSTAKRAAGLVQSGMKVGLGTGSTAAWLVQHLGQKTRDEGLLIQAVPTSTRTADLAQKVGIEIITLDEAGWLDLTIDGADEFDAEFALIKGGGGALLQEKIVAMASDRMIVIADADKEVAQLGAFPLPVEVIPFGMNSTRISIERMLEALGYLKAKISTRMEGDRLFVTDEGNHILDLHMSVINDAKALALALNQLPGVVENGLFIDICSSVIIGHSDGRVETRDLVNGVTENSDMSAQGHNLFSDIED
ncbi:MAG: ribose-5-phosphate isomerase RpiA [Marinovum sp.]|nr:ribose-5-phosphate isomerase RpiA [Marinovum sp.]MBT7905870.1 ribose-5-phosphate isomerase RpiA [Marinovum sp.]